MNTSFARALALVGLGAGIGSSVALLLVPERGVTEPQARVLARAVVEEREREITRLLFDYAVVRVGFNMDDEEGGMLLDELAVDIFEWGGYEPMDR